jgi:hypothetical protein
MCRLTLLTASAGSLGGAGVKRLLMHQTMLYSVADDNQAFGSGLSDGLTVKKSGHSYARFGMSWLPYLAPDRSWLGHVRMPSPGTDRSSALAAHPYSFQNGEAPFILAHNGYMTPTGFAAGPHEPDTDTYRAGVLLEEMLGGRLLQRDIVEEWLSLYNDRSSSSFIILQNDFALVLRLQRTLYAVSVGDGMLINTSQDVLHGVRNTFLQFFNLRMSEPQLIAEDSYAFLRPATQIARWRRLRYDYIPTPTQAARVYKVLPKSQGGISDGRRPEGAAAATGRAAAGTAEGAGTGAAAAGTAEDSPSTD